jgi:hypothetical protein
MQTTHTAHSRESGNPVLCAIIPPIEFCVALSQSWIPACACPREGGDGDERVIAFARHPFTGHSGAPLKAADPESRTRHLACIWIPGSLG